jgi:hypothetical protein
MKDAYESFVFHQQLREKSYLTKLRWWWLFLMNLCSLSSYEWKSDSLGASVSCLGGPPTLNLMNQVRCWTVDRIQSV